jgi:ubiquinone/menaquinone biosynthesis C-methylase UbiE
LQLTQLTFADIGCGTGDLEKYLIPYTHQIFACDISMEMLKVALQRYPIQSGGYIVSDARSTSLPSSSADMVISPCLFHHLQHSDLLPSLSEMKRICRLGGLVICFEQNPLNLLTQLVVCLTPLDRTARLIRHSTMVTAFKSVGLEVLDTRFILFGPKFIDMRLGWIKTCSVVCIWVDSIM